MNKLIAILALCLSALALSVSADAQQGCQPYSRNQLGVVVAPFCTQHLAHIGRGQQQYQQRPSLYRQYRMVRQGHSLHRAPQRSAVHARVVAVAPQRGMMPSVNCAGMRGVRTINPTTGRSSCFVPN